MAYALATNSGQNDRKKFRSTDVLITHANTYVIKVVRGFYWESGFQKLFLHRILIAHLSCHRAFEPFYCSWCVQVFSHFLLMHFLAFNFRSVEEWTREWEFYDTYFYPGNIILQFHGLGILLLRWRFCFQKRFPYPLDFECGFGL